MTPPRASSTALRRFAGAEAEELAILCRPSDTPRDAAHQADAVYRALAAQLSAERASVRDVTTETLFLRDIRRDLPRVLEVRARVLADLGQAEGAPPPAFIGQAPLDTDAAFELAAGVV